MADSIHQKEIAAELAATRNQISGYVTALQRDLDFGSRLKRGVIRNPAAWFGGAAVLGLLLSRIPASRQKVILRGSSVRYSEAQKAGRAGLVLSALKIGLDFAKPALLSWAKSRIFNGASARPSKRY